MDRVTLCPFMKMKKKAINEALTSVHQGEELLPLASKLIKQLASIKAVFIE